jgi:aminoglycoside N3'-acetyltransferase
VSVAVTTEATLVEHLRDLGITPGTDIVVHSRLISFGRIPGGAETVYRALRAAVGAEATIAVPTYTLRPPNGEWFDPKAEKWERLGVLSDYVRQLHGAVRSACTMHSHAAIGTKAKLFETITGDTSLGPGSDFDLLEHLGFTAVFLGCGFPDAATFTFHVEACCGNIPYRHWLELERNARDADDPTRTRMIRYYARRSRDDVEDLEIVRRILDERRVLRTAKCPYGVSYAARLPEYKTTLAAVFAQDPTAVLARGH